MEGGATEKGYIHRVGIVFSTMTYAFVFIANMFTVRTTAAVYNPWTAERKYSPHPIVVCARRVETVGAGCSIDHISILMRQHLYPDPARTGSHLAPCSHLVGAQLDYRVRVGARVRVRVSRVAYELQSRNAVHGLQINTCSLAVLNIDPRVTSVTGLGVSLSRCAREVLEP